MDNFKKYIRDHRSHLETDEPGDEVWSRIEREFHDRKVSVIPMLVKWAVAACVILLAGFGAYVLLVNNSSQIQEFAKAEKPVKQKVPERTLNEQQTDLFVDENDNSAQLAENIVERRLQKEARQQALKDQLYKESTAKAEKTARDKKKEAGFEVIDPMHKAFNEMEVGYASMVETQLQKIKNTPIYAEDANYFHLFKKQFQDLNNDEKLLKQETKKTGINDDIISRMINIYQEKITLLKQLQFEINKMNNKVKNSEQDNQLQTPTYINL